MYRSKVRAHGNVCTIRRWGEWRKVKIFPMKYAMLNHGGIDRGYAFNTLDGIEEVNLIEINLPRYIDDILEHSISEIANLIAKEFSWMIDDDHGLN